MTSLQLRRYLAVLGDRRTWRTHLYLLLSPVVGVVVGSAVIMGVTFSLSLVIVWVGLPLLAVVFAAIRVLGAFERARANALLGVGVTPPAPLKIRPAETLPARWWAQNWARITDPAAWRQALWLVTQIVWGTAGFVLSITVLSLTLAVIADPLWAVALLSGHSIVPVRSEDLSVNREIASYALIGWPVALALLPAAHWLVRGFGAGVAGFARWALGPTLGEQLAATRERADEAETRVRLDQELHDSIGHQLTMTVVQAGAGAHVFDHDPQFARQALLNIEERGRTALAELDRIIGSLHTGDAPFEVQAGIGDLPELVEDSRRAGVQVTACLDAPDVVDAALGRALYSVAREALTNAARHAPGLPVELSVSADGGILLLSVSNPTVPPPAASTLDGSSGAAGRGLAGARRRVTMTGGRFDVADAGGVFTVLAAWPMATQSAGA